MCRGQKSGKIYWPFWTKMCQVGWLVPWAFWTITMRSLMFFETSLRRIIFCDWVLSEKCINQETQWHNRFFFCIFFSKFAIFCKMTTFWQCFATKTYILVGQKWTQASHKRTKFKSTKSRFFIFDARVPNQDSWIFRY